MKRPPLQERKGAEKSLYTRVIAGRRNGLITSGTGGFEEERWGRGVVTRERVVWGKEKKWRISADTEEVFKKGPTLMGLVEGGRRGS